MFKPTAVQARKFFRTAWKNKRQCRNSGYRMILAPDHPAATNGYVYLHRVIMENHLGRYLSTAEVVHHRDENRSNNKLSNLVLTTRSKHARTHNNLRGYECCAKVTCPSCGRKFKQKSNKQNYCSVACGASHRKKIEWPGEKELEKLIWTYPCTQLAMRFGVSDGAVIKRCRKLGIATPGRGYWTKVAVGIA